MTNLELESEIRKAIFAPGVSSPIGDEPVKNVKRLIRRILREKGVKL